MKTGRRTEWRRFLVIALFIAAAGSAEVRAEESRSAVLFPEDRTVVGRTISVVLEPDANLLPGRFYRVTVGTERGPIVNAAKMPHAVPGLGLAPGVNRLHITFFTQEPAGRLKEVASKEVTVFSEQPPNFTPSAPSGFRRAFYHRNDAAVSCLRCHGTGRESNTEGRGTVSENGCVSCHSAVAARRYAHDPVSAGSCGACHDAEERKTAIIPAAFRRSGTGTGQIALCGRCHGEAISRQFTHGPVAAGFCTVCHDPHSSEWPAQLRQPVSVLCKNCHESKVLSACTAKQSAAGGSVVCTSCHDPHGSENRDLLLVKVVIR